MKERTKKTLLIGGNVLAVIVIFIIITLHTFKSPPTEVIEDEETVGLRTYTVEPPPKEYADQYKAMIGQDDTDTEEVTDENAEEMEIDDEATEETDDKSSKEEVDQQGEITLVENDTQDQQTREASKEKENTIEKSWQDNSSTGKSSSDDSEAADTNTENVNDKKDETENTKENDAAQNKAEEPSKPLSCKENQEKKNGKCADKPLIYIAKVKNALPSFSVGGSGNSITISDNNGQIAVITDETNLTFTNPDTDNGHVQDDIVNKLRGLATPHH